MPVSLPRAHPRALTLAVALAALLPWLGGCSSSPGPDCSPTATKASILSTARDYYFFDTLIPASGLNPADATQTPEAFLDAITANARAQGMDRHFSYLTTKEASAAFFDEGTSLGFGVGIKKVGATQLFVTQVFGGSPAAGAGLARGDEFLAIAPSAAALDDAANQLPALLAADAATPGALSAAFSSSVQGTTRWFRLRRVGGATVEVQATTAVYSLDPVPDAAAPRLVQVGGKKVGYIVLRTFVATAEPLLRQAAADLLARGATDLVIDLRYNGGGRLNIAGVFLDLVRAGHPGDLKWTMKLNARHSAEESSALFATTAGALSPGKVAFIVAGGSASASELMVNALVPYLGSNLAVIGDRTYGKPVGQFGFASADCPTMLYLISFKLVNRDGGGDYYQGLPDASFSAAGAASCAAADDLAHPVGDPLEASTAAALQWISAGTCPAGPIPAATPLTRMAQGAAFPAPPEPSLAQRHVPGLF